MKLSRLLGIALISSVISCSQELENTPSSLLIGEWRNAGIIENTNFNQSLNYVFNLDNTFEVYRIVEDGSTNALQGYRYFALGTYAVIGNSLHLSNTSVYEHDDSTGLFSELEHLTLSNDQFEEVVTISFNNKKSELIFIYEPCEPGNCLTSQSFYRK